VDIGFAMEYNSLVKRSKELGFLVGLGGPVGRGYDSVLLEIEIQGEKTKFPFSDSKEWDNFLCVFKMGIDKGKYEQL